MREFLAAGILWFCRVFFPHNQTIHTVLTVLWSPTLIASGAAALGLLVPLRLLRRCRELAAYSMLLFLVAVIACMWQTDNCKCYISAAARAAKILAVLPLIFGWFIPRPRTKLMSLILWCILTGTVLTIVSIVVGVTLLLC